MQVDSQMQPAHKQLRPLHVQYAELSGAVVAFEMHDQLSAGVLYKPPQLLSHSSAPDAVRCGGSKCSGSM